MSCTKEPDAQGPNNNEKFNALLNGCQNPRAVFDFLWKHAADMGKEAAV